MIDYELNCKKCGYSLHFSHGVLMSFNKANQELLERMKNGELGEKFKKMANEFLDAKAYHSCELFRCTKCGELSGEMVIELLGADNSVLAEEEHLCKNCNSKMEMIDGRMHYYEYELTCPRCKEVIDCTQPEAKLFAD